MNLKLFIKNISILSFMGIIVRIIGLVYRIPLTNIIGAEGMGYYGSAFNIYTMILLLASTSIPMAVSNFLSSNTFKESIKEVIFKKILYYSIFIGIIGCLFCFVLAPFLTIGNALAIPILRILAPTIFFSCIMGAYRGYFQSKKNVKPTAYSQFIEQIINAIISVSCAFLFMNYLEGNKAVLGAMGGALGTCLGCFGGCFYLYLLSKKDLNNISNKTDMNLDSKTIYKQLFYILIPMIGCTFVYNISGTIDMTLYYNLLQNKGFSYQDLSIQYGLYSGQIMVLFHIPTAIAASISVSLMPLLTENKKEKNKKEIITQTFKICTIITVPITIGLYFIGDLVLKTLFQSSYETLSYDLLKIIIFAIIPTCFSTITTTILQALKKVKIPLRNTIIALILQTVINLLLFLFTDLNSYILSFSILGFSCLVTILNFWCLNKENIFISWIAIFKIPFIAVIFMSLMIILFKYIFSIIIVSNILQIIIYVFISSISYFSIFGLFYKFKKEW